MSSFLLEVYANNSSPVVVNEKTHFIYGWQRGYDSTELVNTDFSAVMSEVIKSGFSSQEEIEQYQKDRNDFINNLGKYVPKCLDENQIIFAMGYYEENKINSLSDFKQAFDVQVDSYYENNPSADKSQNPDFDYDKSFKMYMNFRGCASESDLCALNSTNFRTVTALLGAINIKLDLINERLAKEGLGLSKKEQGMILSTLNVSDWVNFYKADFKDSVIQFKKLIEKALDFGQNDFDQKLKDKLFAIPAVLDSLLEELDKSNEQSDESTEKSESSEKEDDKKIDKEANMQKYKANVISKYSK